MQSQAICDLIAKLQRFGHQGLLLCVTFLGFCLPEKRKQLQQAERRTRKSNTKLTCRENLNGGLANGGLSHLSTIVHDCQRLSSFCDESFPYERGPKRPQKCTIVDDCAQIAESGLKPPFESPHLDFPEHGKNHQSPIASIQ